MDPSSPEQNNDRQPDRPDRRPEDGRPPMPQGFIFLLIGGLVILLIWNFTRSLGAGSKITYDFFLAQVEEGNVEKVTPKGTLVEGKWKNVPNDPEKPDDPEAKLRDEFHFELPVWAKHSESLDKLLREKGVKVAPEKEDTVSGGQMMMWVFTAVILVMLVLFMIRRASDPMGSGFLGSFSRSPAKRFQASEQRTTYKDVAGMESAKSELMEVVEFLKNPARFQRLGAQIPKGVLLEGPPGTGKTLLARATAGEAGVPFYSINGSEFIQMFVGVGASRVRDLFQTAKDHSPCIVFIDEIDAVGRLRGTGLGGGHDEREQTLNQILSEMDGFEQTTSVIVLAATNRPDVLDPALMRPGRFDRHVTIDRPAKDGRLQILKVHTRKVPLGDDVDLKDIARSTTGFSGAELRNLVNEAALVAVRNERNHVTTTDFDQARDRVLMGPKREEKLNRKERRMTAYHETGHALLAWFQPEVDPVHKVTIIPRGRALGLTWVQPDEERFHVGEKRLHSQLAMFLAGRAAEKMIFDEYSAGAEDDLKRATQIARSMVAYWGMSDSVGPVAFRQGENHPFLGKEIHEHREFSEETAHMIDEEIGRILRDAQQVATSMLEEHRDDLERVTSELLERETLDKEDLIELLGRPMQEQRSDNEDDQESADEAAPDAGSEGVSNDDEKAPGGNGAAQDVADEPHEATPASATETDNTGEGE